MEYKIITSSRYHYVLTVVVLPFVLILIMLSITGPLKYYKGTIFEYLGLILVLGFYGLSWLLAKYTSKGEILIKIEIDGIYVTWLKNYILYKYKDRYIGWEDIKSYKFTPDRWFDIFKIKTYSNGNFVFEHDSIKNDIDDFSKFRSELNKRISIFNKSETSLHKIKKSPTLYDGLSGKILFGFAVFLMIGGFIVLVFGLTKGVKNYSSLFGLLSGMAGGIFTILTIIQRRKNK